MPSVKSIPLHKAVNKKAKPTPPTAVSLHKLLQPNFPLPINLSWQQWRTRYDLKAAEAAVVKCAGLNPTFSRENFRVESLDVPVEIDKKFFQKKTRRDKMGGSQICMNELEVSIPGTENHVVLVHGYGASKGFFYRNYRDIVLGTNSTLHALDWLGYGRSSRVAVNLPRFPTRQEGVHYGEEFFLSAFEQWRQKRRIQKFTFVAHSMGAYLACSYASKHPDKVEKIVLVSPASVNRTIHSIPESEFSPVYPLTGGDSLSPHIGLVPKPPTWFKWMWEQHWSPFSLVRMAGFLGPKLTSGWTSRRFSELPRADQEALQIYAYAMFNAPGSGEYLLNYFLACGGTGRWPLVERLSKVMCPTLWLYGDSDWMPPEGGAEAVKRLRAMGRHAEIEVVPESGHHLYLDNAERFCDLVVGFLNRMHV